MKNKIIWNCYNNEGFCVYFGLSGLLSRPIKIWLDARFTGHEFYEEVNYSIFLASIGDCPDRYILRFNEMIESCRIIYGLLYDILCSFFYLDYSSFHITMELLIEDFLIHNYTLSLIHYSKLNIESSKGIYCISISSYPILIINIISNDFPTLNQLNMFTRYINLSDTIAVLGSIDFVLGSVDLGLAGVYLSFIHDYQSKYT